ncbi:MAG TPA: TIGR03435 family protein [Acidobacteriaceae bacterium]|jgi:uncharacterized protein (TIGR03435 family)|nr:TIGR03435 family protein [Acidobacteriaceae bacterium]
MRSFLPRALAVALLLVTAVGVAQNAAAAPPPETSYVPDWQAAAGGHQEFDVVSVRENKDPQAYSSINIPYGPEDAFHDTGGVLSAKNWLLVQLISFAFKNSTGQREAFRASLPGWVLTTGYDIEARTENHEVTKDQMRLMVQSLLFDRFHLKLHYEMRDVPVYEVVQIKPGVLGPGLRPHPAADACSAMAPRPDKVDPDAPTTLPGGFPVRCGSFVNMEPTASYMRHEGGRDLTMAQIAGTFSGMGNLGRPSIDKTGLTGTYDWVMEFIDPRPGRNPPPDAEGMTFEEALRKQTGLKLVSAKSSVRLLLVDHIDKPTEN